LKTRGFLSFAFYHSTWPGAYTPVSIAEPRERLVMPISFRAEETFGRWNVKTGY
jgi:hypothetical protein